MQETPKRPLISLPLALFLVGIAFAEATRAMTIVQVPIFLRELGADIRQVGLFFTISLIYPFILRIIGGWLSDSIGRLRALWLGSLAGTFAYVPYAIATSWQVALLGPALLAIAGALIYPSYRAYIADNTDEERLGRVFGIAETVRNIAWIIGPLYGGLLAQNLGYRWMFIAAIMSFGVATIIFLSLTLTMDKPASTPLGKPSLGTLRSSLSEIFILVTSGGLITWILITDGVYDIASKMSFDLMPVYLSDIAGLSKQAVGLIDGIHGIAWVAVGPLAGVLIDKTSERFAVVNGLILVILSRLVFALSSSFWGFTFSWILLGLGGAVLSPALNSLVAKGVPSRLRGITYAFIATSLSLFVLPFPWIGSLIWNAINPKAPFFITVIVGSLAIIPAWMKLRVQKSPPDDAFSELIELD
ncbi:MAG: MFS transporter [Anaerolineaceae bacterium]|nr:MAG: MFS transporter [Anaerolineaceae bacterium]